MYPSDINPSIRDIGVLKTMLQYTEKHIQLQPYNSCNLETMVEMCSLFSECKENKFEKSQITLNTAPTSPLQYSENELGIFIVASKYNIPVMVGSTPISGATGPITLVGQLLLMHIENLAGIVILQVLNPGTPVLYGPRPNTMDMKTCNALWGSIEFGICGSAMQQLADYCNLPTDICGTSTDSKTTDEQAAIEKSLNALLVALAKPQVLSGLGFLETINTASIEQLIIDDEIIGMIRHIINGINFDEARLSKEIINEVGYGGHYLSHIHTRTFFRSEHYLPKILDRNSRYNWEIKGAPSLTLAANKIKEKLLKQYEPINITSEQRNYIEKIFLKVSEKIV
jgi:trimethylamine--corrinoid protein Co-methyltransferase